MQEFTLYLKLGWQHIADLGAYDHIVFITALCAIYTVKEWKHLLILITAFTVGHSITLALAALKIVVLPSEIIEFLIPVTIFLTSINNVLNQPKSTGTMFRITGTYLMVVFFGLIHGLGFSNYFTALLGTEQSIVKPLLAFNIGLEVGQILIVAIILILASVVMRLLKLSQRDWTLFVSGAVAGISLILMSETVFW
ncbi:MAG: HupE/UreJ family protein [Sphingobacteriales bacterium]|nr:MAG: HupE/UreJ family protein [Sphingobacteriales bacterium]